jgi:hypothetical protein
MAHGAGQQLAPDWRQLIGEAAANRPQPIMAETYITKWSASPAGLQCSDGRVYAVKGIQQPRIAFNDQVAARLGHLTGAPVPDRVMLVRVPQALIDANQGTMGQFREGIGHATGFIADTTDREGIRYADQPENRSRFAALAVFYGWIGSSDEQFIYRKTAPNLVYSVDHGHFFTGPGWAIDNLRAAPGATPYAAAVQACNLTAAELSTACEGLSAITPEQIAAAVAAPPDEWGVSLDERIAVAEYLHRRQDQMTAACLPANP